MKLNFVAVLFLVLVKTTLFAGDSLVWKGMYRAVLITPGGELPFQLELRILPDAKGGTFTITNGDEQISNSFIVKPNDSFSLFFPVFDTEMRIIFDDSKKESISGKWYDHSRQGIYYLNLYASLDKKYRFIEFPEAAVADISGQWKTIFTDSGGDEETIGIFKQTGTKLSGTFRTTTGDYRFLAGDVSADSFFLSTFNGSHAYLFKGKILADGTLSGKWWSGKNYSAIFVAERNENIILPNPTSLTFLKEGYNKIEFQLPDENGNIITLNDKKFENKVVIIQITGTWCPNCMDATAYLKEIEEKYKFADLEIIALSFERKTDAENFKRLIEKERQHFGISYPILNAGLPKTATEVLPMLNKVMSFPTTIILNNQHEVVEIYTGFNGPATGDVFVEFQKEFEKVIDGLLGE